MKDYYQTLGLQKGANRDEVKKAFRKLSAQYHPDKKTGDESKYKEITEAYATLGDEKKKAEYDTYGHSFAGGQPGGGTGGFNWADFSQGRQGGQGFEFDISDDNVNLEQLLPSEGIIFSLIQSAWYPILFGLNVNFSINSKDYLFLF